MKKKIDWLSMNLNYVSAMMTFNRDYTFQNYLIGDNNRNAIEAVSSAMALPGQIYNPLFVYGAVGVGKTHLLQALAYEYKSELKTCYTTSEQLSNKIIQAMCRRRYLNFIQYLLSFDVLLIDDIHGVSGRKYMMEELLCIFERLYNTHKQIIISADRPPEEIFDRKNGKAKIFQRGLMLKVNPPSYKDRLKFLQVKAQHAGLSPSNAILENLAHEDRCDFRELEGSVAKTKFFSSYTSLSSTNLNS